MVVAGGFEPPTPALSIRCSNQLSYATESDPTCRRLPILESRLTVAGVYRVLVIHWVERAGAWLSRWGQRPGADYLAVPS